MKNLSSSSEDISIRFLKSFGNSRHKRRETKLRTRKGRNFPQWCISKEWQFLNKLFNTTTRDKTFLKSTWSWWFSISKASINSWEMLCIPPVWTATRTTWPNRRCLVACLFQIKFTLSNNCHPPSPSFPTNLQLHLRQWPHRHHEWHETNESLPQPFPYETELVVTFSCLFLFSFSFVPETTCPNSHE